MRYLILAVLMLASAGASASPVYRCDAGGHVTYTDHPCGPGDEAAMQLRDPNLIASPGRAERDLAQQYDERIARERRARDQAYAAAERERRIEVASEERIRSGVVAGKIVRGMTPQQVREVLGEPVAITHSVKKGADQDHWTYKDPDGTVQVVTFTSGQVTGYSKRTKAQTNRAKKKKKDQ